MKILITGGAGFIGSALIRHILTETQDSVINLDALTYAGNADSIPESMTKSHYVFEQVNICNLPELQRVFVEHQPEVVMHLAAESHVDRSITGPDAFIQTNLVGTFNLLEVTRCYWQDLPSEKKSSFRFHHISTDEICDLLEELVPDKPAQINHYRDLITFVEDRPGHDSRYTIDASKIQRELGWVPEESFDTGLRKTVEWFVLNESWWGQVLSGEYQLGRIG